LGKRTLGGFFFLLESHGFAVETGNRFLDDPVTGFDETAEFADAGDDRVLQRHGRNAGGLAGVLPGLVGLPGADVVEVLAPAAVSGRTDHVGTARAAKQA